MSMEMGLEMSRENPRKSHCSPFVSLYTAPCKLRRGKVELRPATLKGRASGLRFGVALRGPTFKCRLFANKWG